MKALIRATAKARRSFLPITRFAFQRFTLAVRREAGDRPLTVGAFFKRVKTHPRGKIKTIPKPIHAAQAANIFLPSPALQGRGLMCLRLGARLVVHPAALSSPASPTTVRKLFNPCDTLGARAQSSAGCPSEPQRPSGATPYSQAE
jgi:hypothetical protein